MNKVIIVSGTPGTGKTTFAKKYAKEKKFGYVDVTALIKKHKLHSGYDRKFKSYSVDIAKLNKFLVKLVQSSDKSLVIDSHLSHYLPADYVDLCFIMKTPIKKLRARLKRRGYSADKIQENVDAEIMDVCFNEAKELGHKVKLQQT